MAEMTEDAREAFLAAPRLGILTMLQDNGAPIAVPIWFEWNGERALAFTSVNSPKVARLQQDRRASLLITNIVGEPEAWVAIDSNVRIEEEGAAELARRLADRYWDMSDDDHRATVDMWTRAGSMLRVLVFEPTAIRSYGG